MTCDTYISPSGSSAKYLVSKQVAVAYDVGQKSNTKRYANEASDGGFTSQSKSQNDGNNNAEVTSDEIASALNDTNLNLDRLLKRGLASDSDTNWHLSQMSTPAKVNFNDEDTQVNHSPNMADPDNGKFYWEFDDSYGRGQTIYMVEASWFSGSPVSISLQYTADAG
jgi:hypothetical protein